MMRSERNLEWARQNEGQERGDKALAESKVESESSGQSSLNNLSNKGKSKMYFWKFQWGWLDSVNI